MRQSSSCRRSRPDPQVFTWASRCPLMFVDDTTENVLALLLSGTRRTAEIRPAAAEAKNYGTTGSYIRSRSIIARLYSTMSPPSSDT
jgi:hypothetical protein